MTAQGRRKMKIPIESQLYSSLASSAQRGRSPESTVSASVPQPVGGQVLSVLRRAGIFLYLMPVMGLLVSPAHGQASNPIVVENQQPGTDGWKIPFGSAATDA